MATIEQLSVALQNADAAATADPSNVEAANDARQLATAIKQMQSAPAPQPVQAAPVQGEQPQQPTLASQSPFDQSLTNRGDWIYPFAENAQGEEVLAVPSGFKEMYEGAMIPGRSLAGEGISDPDLIKGAQATTPTGRGLIGGSKAGMRTKTSREVKDEAGKIYKQVEDSPNIVDAPAYDGLVAGLAEKLHEEAITPKGYPKVWSVLKDMTRYTGREMPNKRLMAHLRVLNKDTGADEARVAKMVSDYIKDYLIKNGDDAVANDFTLLSKADTLWAKGSTASTFENAIEKATHAPSGFENGLRLQFGQILKKNIDGKLYLPDNVKAAVEKVVDGTIPANAYKKIGKFGPGIGQQTNGLMAMLLLMSGGGAYAAGGVPGMLGVGALAAGGQAAQMAAKGATKNAANQALAAQAGRVPTGQYTRAGGVSRAGRGAISPMLGNQQKLIPGLLSDEKGSFL